MDQRGGRVRCKWVRFGAEGGCVGRRGERELESRSKPSLTGLLPAERASEASGREVKLAEG